MTTPKRRLTHHSPTKGRLHVYLAVKLIRLTLRHIGSLLGPELESSFVIVLAISTEETPEGALIQAELAE